MSTTVRLEVDEMKALKQAVEATGESQSEIMRRCFREACKAVVKKLLLEQGKKAKDFLKKGVCP